MSQEQTNPAQEALSTMDLIEFNKVLARAWDRYLDLKSHYHDLRQEQLSGIARAAHTGVSDFETGIRELEEIEKECRKLQADIDVMSRKATPVQDQRIRKLMETLGLHIETT